MLSLKRAIVNMIVHVMPRVSRIFRYEMPPPTQGGDAQPRLLETTLRYNWARVLLSATLFGGAVRYCIPLVKSWYVGIRTWLLDWSVVKPAIAEKQVRSAFLDTPFPRAKPASTAPHAEQAGNRSQGSAFIELVAKSLGQVPFFHQCSNADLRHGRDGSRAYYWAKDVAVAPAAERTEQAVHVMVDVDYYADMPRFLCEHRGPVMLYTTIPTAAAHTEPGLSFRFNQQGELVTTVSGGAEYRHLLWNYGVDFVVAASMNWGFLQPLVDPNIPTTRFWPSYSATAYNVDRRTAPDSPHRSVVLLAPVGTWYGIWATLLLTLEHRMLRRHDFLSRDAAGKPDGFVRVGVMKEDAHLVSTARVDSHRAVTVPVTKDDEVATFARLAPTTLSVPSVLGIVETREDAAILVEYHRLKRGTVPDTVHTAAVGVKAFVASPSHYDEDAKPSIVAYMSPVVEDGVYAPVDSVDNDAAGVAKRVTELASSVEPTEFHLLVIEEFIDRLFPQSGLLHPVEYETVVERQSRPSQRRLLVDAENTVAMKRRIKSFVKNEPYPEPKAPRMISQINTHDKVEYSQLTYALCDWMHDAPSASWYAFAKKPREIAEEIAAICADADYVIKTDFSRFDGRVSSLLRHLERQVLLRAFGPQYHGRILEIHRSQYTLPAISKNGVAYDTIYARNSGSPETSLFNSIANAFVNFLAFRMMHAGSSYLQADAAYGRLGIYGGDDGLTANLPPALFNKAAASVGQSAKTEKVRRGELGVMFLARCYGPNVWYGDANSCCDVARQVAKFHTSVTLPPSISPLEKLVTKLRAFALTDANTPVFRTWIRAVEDWLAAHTDAAAALEAKIAGHEVLLATIKPWGVQEHPDASVQYPNEDSGWMEQVLDDGMPGFDLARFESWCANMTSIDVLSPPICWTAPKPDVKDFYIVGDEAINKPEGWKQVAPAQSKSTLKPETTYRGKRPATARSRQWVERKQNPTSAKVGSATRPPRQLGTRRGPEPGSTQH